MGLASPRPTFTRDWGSPITGSAAGGGRQPTRDPPVISHVVLIKPRADLTSEESRAFVAAFERAILEIPTVRAVRIGHRIRHGAAYESLGPDMADYIAVIDFENLDGLQAYL